MALFGRDRVETAGLFPLAEFLSSLSDLGIRVTLDDDRRIALALRAGGPWTRTQLRGVLASLLVRDRDQLTPFRLRFDAFFSLTEPGEAPIASLDVERALSELRQAAAEPRSKRIALAWPLRSGETGTPVPGDDETERPLDHPWRWTALGVLLLTGLLLLGHWIARPRPLVKLPAGRPTPTVAKIPNSIPPLPLPNRTTQMRTYPEAPVLRFKAYRPWPQPPAWTDFRLLAVAALGWGVWVWRWVRSLRRITIQDESKWDSGPRLFRPGTVGGMPAPRLDRQTLDRVADSLGYFRSEQAGKDLDVQESVERTIRNGGIPTPVFALRRQVRSVLILEDRLAEAREWNPIARELAQGLSERAVPVMHGVFLGVPDRFRSADGFDLRIEDLEDERRGYLVLIFSDAKGLGSAEAAFVLERLARWPQVAWMQLQERRAWDRTARRPALHGLPVFPADPQGLLEALSLFTTERAAREAGREPEAWRGLSALPVHGSLEAHFEAVLGDSLLWAQSCAMVPPPISLGLADRLRERFHPELPASRIERLLALPGSSLLAGGLQLDDRSLAVLREGFASSHTPREQEAVLRFLLAQIAAAEPTDRDSAAHQAWEWRLERTRLDLDPERAVERLLALAQGPLREAIRTDLARRWKPRPAKKRWFLPGRSISRNTAERLNALVENREFPSWERFQPRLWPEHGLAVAAAALAAIAVLRGTFPHENSVLLLFRNTLYTTEPIGQIEISRQTPQGIEPLDRQFFKGATIFPDQPTGQFRLAMLLAGKGVTTTRLKASRAGIYELEVGTKSMELPCQEELPEMGLIISRCPAPGRRAPKNIKERLLPTNNWLATVGLEVTPRGRPTEVGRVLLEYGIVQVVYTLQVPDFRPEELKEPKAIPWIRNRWNPWTNRVRMVSWASIENRNYQVKANPTLRREVSLAAWRPTDIVTAKQLASILLETRQRAVTSQPSGQLTTKPSMTQQSSEPPATKPFTVEPEPPRAAEPSQRKTTEHWFPWGVIPPTPSGTEGLSEGRSNTPEKDSPSVGASPCPNPALARCGDQCVDLKTNPFHFGSCFQIAPSLSRSAAESVDSPPPWSVEAIRCRRYYRLFYAWNDEHSAVVVRSLPSPSGWNCGPAFDSNALTLSSERIATGAPILAVTDLEIHCARNASIAAGHIGTIREVNEKLSMHSTWRSFASQPWPSPDEISTNTGLAETLGSVLADWEKFCLDH